MNLFVRSLSQVLPATLCLAIMSQFGCNSVVMTDEPAHALEVNPEILDFGYTASGDFSDSLAVEISNPTANPIEIQAIRVEDEANVFSIHESPAQLPANLNTGNSVQVSVYFSPVTEDQFVGWLEIVTDADTDGPLVVPLGGCSTDVDCVVDFGDLALDDDTDDDDQSADDDDQSTTDDDDTVIPGVIVVDPTNIDFGTLPQNQAAVGDVATIENLGEGALTISSVSITSNTGDESLFTVAGFTGGTVQPGASPISLNLTFTPGSADVGLKYADLVISSDDPATPELLVPLTAEVTEDCGACTPEWTLLDGQSLGFDLGSMLGGLGGLGGGLGGGGTTGMEGPQYLQVSTGTFEVRIQNTGSGPGTLTSVTEGGTLMGMLPVPDSPDIAYIGGAPLTLGAGETGSLQFQVTGSATCEMVDVDGALSFILGSGSPDSASIMDCMDLGGLLGGGGLPF